MKILRSPVSIALLLVAMAAAIVVACGAQKQEEINALQADVATRAARMAASVPASNEDVLTGTVAVAPAQAITGALSQATTLPPTPAPLTEPRLAATATPLPLAPPPTPLPAYTPPQSAVALTGLSHMWQTWNNCGPATLAMNLSYFGSTLGQAEIGNVLRSHEDDKNVGPIELAAFAQSQGYDAQVRVNGNDQLMKLLLSNGVPVLIETWLEPEPNDGMGHYRLLTGYDDAGGYWIGYDSYYHDNLVNPDGDYQGIRMPFGETNELWKVFNYTYLLIYSEAQAPTVQAIFGAALDPTVMWQESLQAARTAVDQRPADPYAWFNLGTSLHAFGDHAGAVQAYDQARQIGLPWRMLWYQYEPFASYYAVGRYGDVLTMADTTLATTKSIEEIYYWRGQALAALGNREEARQAWQQALNLNGRFAPAQEALAAF